MSRRAAARRAKTGALSADRYDKFLAAMSWYVGKDKGRPEYAAAPAYFDAVLAWHERLSLDDVELVGTVHTIHSTPRYGGETTALAYAAGLPPAPPAPAAVRRSWGIE